MDKLKGFKTGDRVRVTFEASVIEAGSGGDYPIRFRPHGAALDAQPGLSIINHPTFHIERIEKPLAVGDRVRAAVSGSEGEIVWMGERHVVIVSSQRPTPYVIHIDNAERIS